MPILQEVIDLEATFNSLQDTPIILNDLAAATEADRILTRELLSNRFSSDMFSLVPRCMCGACRGEHYLSINHKCSVCGHYVKSTVMDDIESQVWIRQPVGVAKLMTPICLRILLDRFKKASFNAIQYLIDPSYSIAGKKLTAPMIAMQKLFPVRNYNYFVENFDQIMEILFSMPEFAKTPKSAPDMHKEFIYANRHLIFTSYIPVPNRSVLYIEDEAVGKYVYEDTLQAIDLLETMASIDKDYYCQKPDVKANRTAKCLIRLCDFYKSYLSDTIGGKPGLMRRQQLTSRATYAARAVITSITRPCETDEIILPWTIMIAMFQHHIMNYLERMGIPYNMALGKIRSAVYKYDSDIDAILNRILESSKSKYGGIVSAISRPPMLLQSSIIRVRITEYKKDPSDLVMAISPLLCASMNAEYLMHDSTYQVV